MNWWRAHHGLPYDSKLAVVAKRCGVRRCEVLAVWVACLDYASQHEDRGAVQGIDPEELGVSLDMETLTVECVLSGFRERDMISVTPCNASETPARERITAWERRQVQRERDDDSTERVRRYRQKLIPKELPAETPASRHVTPRNAPEQNREEQNREEKKAPPPQPRRVVAMPDAASSEIGDWFDERMRRHPNKRDAMLAQGLLSEVAGAKDSAWRSEFARVHDLWCDTEMWTWKGGARAPTMAQWITDKGWKYEPPQYKTETQRAMEAL